MKEQKGHDLVNVKCGQWEFRDLTTVTAWGPWESGGAIHSDGKPGVSLGEMAVFSSGCDELEVPEGHPNGFGCMILEPRGER